MRLQSLTTLLTRNLVLSILIFIIVFYACTSSVINKQQLGFMGGMAEEYLILGYNFYATGEFYGTNNAPLLLRAPGYPFFIATLLHFGNINRANGPLALDEANTNQLQHNLINLIYLSQCILLSLSAVILFLWLSCLLRPVNAAAAAIFFGCNPYTVILTGLFHYSILHIFFVIISGYILTLAIKSQKISTAGIVASGIVWGISTLIRSTTLILPLFVFVIFLIKFKRVFKTVLIATTLFILGMAIVVLPYSARNYIITNKFILVNPQGNAALWAATMEHPKTDPNHYKWWNIWYSQEGLGIFQRATKSESFDTLVYLSNILKMEDEFKKEALRNLKQHPEIYIHNFTQNIKTFIFGINSAIIKIYQAIQDPAIKIDIKEWLKVGNPQTFYPSFATIFFEYLIRFLTVLGIAGICVAVIHKDQSLLIPGLLYACFCVAHAITYMDFMYYYIKIPFLFIFAAYFINTAEKYQIRLPFIKCCISPALIFNLAIGIAIITLDIIVL